MSNYTITTDFAGKDTLPAASSDRIIKGSEFATEFNNIATAVNSKVGVTNSDFIKLTEVTATSTELNYVDGVTSNIQDQIDGVSSPWTANTGPTSISIYDTNGGVFIFDNTQSGVPQYIEVDHPSSLPNSYYHKFSYLGTAVGSITRSSSTGVSFNTSSDYRLKENVQPIISAAERVKQLSPCRFNFIADPDTTVDGFLAHEAKVVVPESVVGEKDAVDSEGNPVYQGIDQSKIVPLLTAALQEALERIEALEGGA